MAYLAVMIATMVGSVLANLVLFGRNGLGIARGLGIGIVANSVFFIALVYFRRSQPFLVHHPASFYVVSTLIILAGIALMTAGAALLYGRTPLPGQDRHWRSTDVLLILAGSAMLGISGLMVFGAKLTLTYGQKITAEQFLFVLSAGVKGTAAEIQAPVINRFVVPSILAFLVGGCLGFLRSDIIRRIRLWKSARSANRVEIKEPARIDTRRNGKPRQKPKNAPAKDRIRGRVLRLVAMVCCVGVLGVSVNFGMQKMPLAEIITNELTSSTYIEDNYVAPTPERLHWPQQKRNLIHIYLESMENSFYDKAHGGYNDYNMMPDLMQLNAEGVFFSDRDEFGGPYQTYGSTHSISSMVNMSSGVPMKSSISANINGMIYPTFTTIGDLLHEQGYNTEFMLPGSMRWGELGAYYQDHGHFQLWGWDEVRARGILPSNYLVWWGYEDDKLYEYAKEELTRLAAQDKPFYFVMENADTHSPEGYLSPNAKERPFPEQYSNVIFYSQAQVTQFIRWIQQQDFYKDTTVIVTGDHPSMAYTYFQNWDPNYRRTIVNFIFNSVQPTPAKDRTHGRLYAPFDFFPTILAAMGVGIDGDRLGLGTNLFSNTPTLLERDGLDKVQSELKKKSNFYWAHAKSYTQLAPEQP